MYISPHNSCVVKAYMVFHAGPWVKFFGALAAPARLVNGHDFPMSPERYEIGVLGSTRDAVDNILGQFVIASVQVLFRKMASQQIGRVENLHRTNLYLTACIPFNQGFIFVQFLGQFCHLENFISVPFPSQTLPEFWYHLSHSFHVKIDPLDFEGFLRGWWGCLLKAKRAIFPNKA